MLYNDHDEQSMNKFVLVSLILHAILFITYPQWSSILVSDNAGIERGGVIQVMNIESSPTRQLSPVTDRQSRAEVPRVTEPRPTPEPPEREAVAQVAPEIEEPALPRPAPRPEPEPEPRVQDRAVVPAEPSPPQPEVQPEPEPEPVPEEQVTPEPDTPPAPSEILTSDRGTEIALEEQTPVAPEETAPAQERPETEPRETEDDRAEAGTTDNDQGPSGSGDSAVGGDQDNAGAQDSGSGEEEIAPPPPPPPPSGRSVHLGGGSPVYPKDAEDEGVEGTVGLEVVVAADGTILKVDVISSSGDQRLDRQARRTIEQLWQFQGAELDYVLLLDVEFGRLQSGGAVEFSANVHFGEVTWLEAE